ncbi:uncharacterized protein CANTADRAFT_5453 [Suhomyces tanzawaensis NRRL Y-17324]|uniref:Phospholipid/glycerol acyltransferase domain-containing protein n=1 Tax=Suhomyces tanzawaensis NRRL Y-17324 TaxID=984487 RepID=A0A1E4SJQ3_9ASCO|nr:uncharacterized protein CANTADRAFT_5453 [Suhomyces tanzawaensis NRRL Y-17324]ODV79736.1 hypothetical protein CANTADRAFT_5453 [Suhomyces tanzawaensis NRRL Y-17324]
MSHQSPAAAARLAIVRILLIISYDLVLGFFSLVIHTFFRDIKTRGSFNIPKRGPVVFVIAPHHNQFVDGLVVMSKVWEHSGRRIAFLIANKSYKRGAVGAFARLCSAIPVERAQDILTSGSGTITFDGTSVTGSGTKFTQECEIKGLIGLPNSMGNSPIASIEDDTHLTLKAPLSSINPKHQSKIELLSKEGTSFKVAPHIDNNIVFQNVFSHLQKGRVLGIFPEGGSHDRPDLLPLKPGVAIMALGAIASQLKDGVEDIEPVTVVPVGMNYFHPNKFRSRVVLDFGKPIEVGAEMGKKYNENSRDAVGKLLETITLGLKEVTVTCPDYETLIAVQAARRLYTSHSRSTIPLPMVVELNRRLVKGYTLYAEDPDVKELKTMVSQYDRELTRLGIRDHQVESLDRANRLKVFILFTERLFKFGLFMGLSLPGIFLFSPVFITARRISRKKAKEALAASVVKISAKDVLSTWKIMVALVLAPALYIFYSVIGTVLIVRLEVVPSDTWGLKVLIFLFCYGWAVLTTYASLRVGEIGVDYYKSLAPLFVSILSHHSQQFHIKQLKETRAELSERVNEFCEKYGPELFDDYGIVQGLAHKQREQDDESIRSQMSEASDDAFSLNNLGDVPIFSNLLDTATRLSRNLYDEDANVSEVGDAIEDSDGHPEEAKASLLRQRILRTTKSSLQNKD